MGLMGFANLAHAAFAMLGGYCAVTLMSALGWPFFLALVGATVVTAVVAAAFERTIFRRIYRAPELDQVLLTLGLVFMAVAAATRIWGPSQQPVNVPAFLTGSLHLGPLDFETYRLFLIVVGGVVTTALVLGLERTAYGARVRAAVDNRRMTASCGIDVDRLFTLTFAVGAALAGLGGAMSINLLGLDPSFPLRYLVYILIVVVVGGLGSMRGTLVAALALGISDVVGKYYLPQAGPFIIYAITVAVLLARPAGLFARR